MGFLIWEFTDMQVLALGLGCMLNYWGNAYCDNAYSWDNAFLSSEADANGFSTE